MFRTFNAYWDEVNARIQGLSEYENPKESNFQPKDRETVYSHVVALYLRYIQSFRKMEVFF